MKNLVIAIDGHSGCGKSTTAKAVAARLNFKYLDSGAMYRAVTLYFLRNNIDSTQEQQVKHALENIKIDFIFSDLKQRYETILNGKNIEDEIRKSEISDKVSEISALSPVRYAMIEKQRNLASAGSIVMDGRDIGTTVFPGADLKIFMTAEIEERARRRKLDLESINDQTPIEKIIDNLRERDFKDMNRAISPLKKADDALIIDTSKLTFEEQVNKIVKIASDQLNIKV